MFCGKSRAFFQLLYILSSVIAASQQTSLRIAGFLGFCHHLVFRISLKRTQHFGNWIYFPSSDERWETSTLLHTLERADLNHWTTLRYFKITQQSRCLPPLTQDGNVQFLKFLDTRQWTKPNIPSSEPIRMYQQMFLSAHCMFEHCG
jgi:hypothetical protein